MSLDLNLNFPAPTFGAPVDNQQRCYVRPALRTDPDHPEMLYLEYGVKAQNYFDTTAFWRDWDGLQLPNDEYSALLMDWQRKRSLDSDQHAFLPRRQSIYAPTPVESRAAPEPDVPLGDYVRGSRDDICVAPWQVMAPPPAPRAASPVASATAPAPTARTLNECLVEFSGFSFNSHSGSLHDHDDDSTPPPSSASSGSSSDSGRSECSTPMTTPERIFKPLPRRSTSPPTSRATSQKRRTIRAPSPTSSSSGDEYEDDDYYRAPKRKAVSAPRKTAVKRARPFVSGPSPTPSSGVIHPPLPSQPNARGRWSCPYASCTHETGAIGDLQRHLESLAHTPEKRHRCETCGTTFTRGDALKRHVIKRPEHCRQIARGLIKA